MGDAQPIRYALVIASRKITSAAEESTAPSQSKPTRLAGRSGPAADSPSRNTIAAMTETSPRGTPMKKMKRQPKIPTTAPPITGPLIAPSPTTVKNSPITLPLSLAGNEEVTMAIPLAWIMAEPAPWSTLNRMTLLRDTDSPVSTAPRMKMANPAV